MRWPLRGWGTVDLDGVLFDGTTLPMVAMIAASAVGAFVLGRLTLSGRVADLEGRSEAAEEATPAE